MDQKKNTYSKFWSGGSHSKFSSSQYQVPLLGHAAPTNDNGSHLPFPSNPHQETKSSHSNSFLKNKIIVSVFLLSFVLLLVFSLVLSSTDIRPSSFFHCPHHSHNHEHGHNQNGRETDEGGAQIEKVVLPKVVPMEVDLPDSVGLGLPVIVESNVPKGRIAKRHGHVPGPVPEIILNNGALMPVLAAGTWEYESAVAEHAVFTALNVGFTHIDTAHNYHNQDGVGRGLARYLASNPNVNRNNIFITTKVPGCGSDGVALDPDGCARDTNAALLENLKLLNVSHVDLLLIHFGPMGEEKDKSKVFGCGDTNCARIRAQWKVLQKAFMLKEARTIGVSNFCVKCLECLRTGIESITMPAVNQVQFHIGMGSDPKVKALLDYCEKYGVVLQAYSPLGDKNSDIVHNEVLKRIGKNIRSGHEGNELLHAEGKSAAQVALKWILEKGIPLVVKSNKEAHLREDLLVADSAWNLTDAAMKEIDALTEPNDKPSFTCDE